MVHVIIYVVLNSSKFCFIPFVLNSLHIFFVCSDGIILDLVLKKRGFERIPYFNFSVNMVRNNITFTVYIGPFRRLQSAHYVPSSIGYSSNPSNNIGSQSQLPGEHTSHASQVILMCIRLKFI